MRKQPPIDMQAIERDLIVARTAAPSANHFEILSERYAKDCGPWRGKLRRKRAALALLVLEDRVRLRSVFGNKRAKRSAKEWAISASPELAVRKSPLARMMDA